MEKSPLFEESVSLLSQLIATQSFSREEHITADIIQAFLEQHGAQTHRLMNNVWAFSDNYDQNKPTILLNSHN
ncbi:MAG TPA: acetylornithine deacetylase, partial [Candidatus Kapabacteria bacterium]|nr:acetylornithine deacetylase [Candidatus Kapabacteria bacterium]